VYRLFLLGDSISIQYRPYLMTCLEGIYTIRGKEGEKEALNNLDIPEGSNGGDSGMVLKYLTAQPDSMDCDLFAFNCGLHDIKGDLETGALQVPLEQYRANLEAICALLAKHPLKPAFIRSTPVDDVLHAQRNRSFSRKNADLIRYNTVADEVMKARGIPLIDLYAFTRSLGSGIFQDHVHFIPEVRRLQAAYIAGAVDLLTVCRRDKPEHL
jgi:lysophospholipase L1-like esterase